MKEEGMFGFVFFVCVFLWEMKEKIISCPHSINEIDIFHLEKHLLSWQSLPLVNSSSINRETFARWFLAAP